MSHNDTVIAAVSQLYTESLQAWECVDTPEIGLYMSGYKEPALVSNYSQSAGWLIPCK